jgi:hypothetical protein
MKIEEEDEEEDEDGFLVRRLARRRQVPRFGHGQQKAPQSGLDREAEQSPAAAAGVGRPITRNEFRAPAQSVFHPWLNSIFWSVLMPRCVAPQSMKMALVGRALRARRRGQTRHAGGAQRTARPTHPGFIFGSDAMRPQAGAPQTMKIEDEDKEEDEDDRRAQQSAIGSHFLVSPHAPQSGRSTNHENSVRVPSGARG